MNEPVAWMQNGKEFYVQKNYCPDFIPLYTHPVKEQDESFDRTASHMAGEYVSYPVKELTDEEIIELWKQAIQDGYTEMIIHDSQTLDTKKTMFEFARAILRKASEK